MRTSFRPEIGLWIARCKAKYYANLRRGDAPDVAAGCATGWIAIEMIFHHQQHVVPVPTRAREGRPFSDTEMEEFHKNARAGGNMSECCQTTYNRSPKAEICESCHCVLPEGLRRGH